MVAMPDVNINYIYPPCYEEMVVETPCPYTAGMGFNPYTHFYGSVTTSGSNIQKVQIRPADAEDTGVLYYSFLPEEQENNAEVSSLITSILENLGLSKNFLAQTLSVSRQTIYDWLDGKAANIQDENLEKLYWFQAFSNSAPSSLKGKVGLLKGKMVSPGITIEDIMLNFQNYDPEQVWKEIHIASHITRERPKIGAWKKPSKLDTISEVSAGHIDND